VPEPKALARRFNVAVAALRIFIFTLLPLLLGGLVIWVDRSVTSRERKLEVLLIFMFAIGVAGSGIFNFISHFFLSDITAEAIGWETGSPFQLEVAFANLVLGLLGIVATGRRDGFREATVMAATIFAFGATIVHLMDIVETGNLAPGNTIQNVGNLLKPTLLIVLLVASRRAEKLPGSEAGTDDFERWRTPLLQASAPLTIIIATAYSLGYALDQPWLITSLGVLLGAALLVFILARSPSHQLKWR
jgi:hypothetical protein